MLLSNGERETTDHDGVVRGVPLPVPLPARAGGPLLLLPPGGTTSLPTSLPVPPRSLSPVSCSEIRGLGSMNTAVKNDI